MRELATRSGVDVSVISRAERGVGNLPRLTTILKLIEGLELTADGREELLLFAGHIPFPESVEFSLLQRVRDLEERMADMQARLETLEQH